MLEGRGLHPRTRKNEEGASSVEARIILLLNAHTIVTMMMIRKKRRRRKMRRRRVWHSKPHHDHRARPRKIHQVKMMI